MTDDEVTKLCKYIAEACPSQRFGEFTSDVWAEILPRDFTLAECRSAVAAVKQRQPFVDVSDVTAQVRRTRAAAADKDRLRTILDPAAYRAEIEAADARVLAAIQRRAGRPLQLKAIPARDDDINAAEWAARRRRGEHREGDGS